MKKIIATLILASLILSLIPLSVSAEEVSAPVNLALGLPAEQVLTNDGYHTDTGWNWGKDNLNDGDTLEVIIRPDNGTLGSGGGYHSQYGGTMPAPQYVGFDFGSAKSFDTLIAYAVAHNTFPVDFTIDVSDDGETWTTVHTETNYTTKGVGGALPQSFTFAKQTARFVRLHATTLSHDGANYAMKLSEVEVYDLSDVPAAPVNLAEGKPVSSDSAHSDGSWWQLNNINDGNFQNVSVSELDYGQFAGYHTHPATPRDGSENARAQFTIELGEGTKFDQVVIIPSNELYSVKTLRDANEDPNNKIGICFPENFRIQISNDGETWTDVVVKENYSCTTPDPQVFEFDEVTAKYVRFQMEKLTKYIKLTEFAVYNIPEEVVEPDTKDEPVTPPETTPAPVPTGDGIVITALITVSAICALGVVIRRRKIEE